MCCLKIQAFYEKKNIAIWQMEQIDASIELQEEDSRFWRNPENAQLNELLSSVTE